MNATTTTAGAPAVASNRLGAITPDFLEAQILGTEYFQLTGTLTVCVLSMANGLTVTGESAVLDPARFNKALGEKYARENAVSKLWQLEGYARACVEARNRDAAAMLTYLNVCADGTKGAQA